MAAPEFLAEAGEYAEQATVGLTTCEQGVKLRYIVERLAEGQEESDRASHLHVRLAREGLLYRRPVVLDEYGTYFVHAMCIRDDPALEVSEVVSQKYVVRPTVVVPLQGRHLMQLPKQMVRGLLHLAGATTRAIAPKLESLRRALAHAAKTTEAQVSVHMDKLKNRHAGSVAIRFSVQVAEGEDAEAMAHGITDPSLVERIAEVSGVRAERIRLEAAAQPLTALLLHLSWNYPAGHRDYLDGSCLIYAEDQLLDVVDYRGAESVHRSKASGASCEWSAGKGPGSTVLHSGDVMSASGGRHAIYVKLAELPDFATDCFFTLTAYFCRNLSKFISPRVLFFDAEDTSHLLAEYVVADAGCASAAVVCSLARAEGGAWSVIAYGQTCDGTVRDYSPVEAAIAVVQARYGKRSRRCPLILLHALWHDNRAFPRATQEREDIIVPCLELEPELFRLVVSFL